MEIIIKKTLIQIFHIVVKDIKNMFNNKNHNIVYDEIYTMCMLT